MRIARLRNAFLAAFLLPSLATAANGQRTRSSNSTSHVPTNILLQIVRAEDERGWDGKLKTLLTASDAAVRKRAALAGGRIGDEAAVPPLTEVLLTDRDADVRQMAAFALGEIESAGGLYALLEVLKKRGSEMADATVRARAVEALGKIAAAMASSAPASTDASKSTQPQDDRLDTIRAAILDTLRFEDSRRQQSDRLTILLGLTAVLRAKPDAAGTVIKRFLDYTDPRIVADALNTLARLRLKDGNDEARQLLVKHSDPIVRANAARALGAAEDKQAFDVLLDRALHDEDLRVRVSAIRALGSLKDARAGIPLLAYAAKIFEGYSVTESSRPSSTNELLELATSLGRLFQQSKNEPALEWLRKFRQSVGQTAAEIDLALARIDPARYSKESINDQVMDKNKEIGGPWWQLQSSWVQGLSESNKLGGFLNQQSRAIQLLIAALMMNPQTPTEAMPEILRSYAEFKPDNLADILRANLKHQDTIVRATAAELLAGQPPAGSNTLALETALPRALQDRDLNDAALAILDALAKQKSKEANDALKTALDSSDHLIRRKAVALLKANGVGDFSNRIGTVQARNTDADYRRAIARIGRKVTATVVTSKGSFAIEFLPEEAPLTVDNFIQLAKKGFFNGQTIPRVVPNFVIQAGDPRGDLNGGPGYQIRCEINEVPYERGAVGMALSGKDTGGSQWFVTHSPQPHLDGGYTVFGRVISGMAVVDNIARGDVIRRVVINER